MTMTNDELADRALAIVDQWRKHGRSSGDLYNLKQTIDIATGNISYIPDKQGPSCLLGANALVINNVQNAYVDDEFVVALVELLPTRYQGYERCGSWRRYAPYESVYRFNDGSSDETVISMLEDFATKYRSDEYRSGPV